jgi:hypothetical protein
MLTREQILAATKALPTDEVDIKGLGKVRIRAISKKVATSFKGKDENDIVDQIIRLGVVDDKDQPLFTSEDSFDEWPAGIAGALSEAICELSGMNIEKKMKK